MPTLKDVAREADVSISTVSRVFNDPEKARPDTQQRVREAAEALDYKPSRVARRLRLEDGKASLLGLVIPDIQNPFFFFDNERRNSLCRRDSLGRAAGRPLSGWRALQRGLPPPRPRAGDGLREPRRRRSARPRSAPPNAGPRPGHRPHADRRLPPHRLRAGGARRYRRAGLRDSRTRGLGRHHAYRCPRPARRARRRARVRQPRAAGPHLPTNHPTAL